MKTKLAQQLVLLIAFIGLLFLNSCGSVRKLKEEKNELKRQITQKDSLIEISKKETETTITELKTEISDLKKEISSFEENKTSTKTVVTLKPEKDENGNIIPSEFVSEKNGVKTSIKINGKGEVTSEIQTSNSSKKEVKETENKISSIETQYQLMEKEFKEKAKLQQQMIDELNSKITNYKVEKKTNNFWFMFWIGFAIGCFITILVCRITKKFSFFTKIKNFFT
jgi:Fe2+ transport system protein B